MDDNSFIALALVLVAVALILLGMAGDNRSEGAVTR